MSIKGKTLFSEGDLSQHLLDGSVQLREVLERAVRKGMSGPETREQVDEFLARGLTMIELKEAEQKISRSEVKTGGDGLSSLLGGPLETAAEQRVEIPFTGSELLFQLKPSSAPGRTAPPALVEQGKLILTYRVKDNDQAALKAELTKDLDLIRSYLKQAKRELKYGVADLTEEADKLISRLDKSAKVSAAPTEQAPPAEPRPSVPASPVPSDPMLAFGTVSVRPSEEALEEPERVEAASRVEPYTPPPLKDGLQPKYIVELDLYSYSDIGREIEKSLGARAVQVLNQHIRDFVSMSLERLGSRIELFPMISTGDGAILAFDDAAVAERFAEGIHRLADQYNRGKETKTAHRHFRIGVTHGEIVLERQFTAGGEVKGFEMAGSAIAKAVRLEGACQTGEICIDEKTYSDLPPETQDHYGGAETVKGKRDEQFSARRRKVVEPAS